MRMSAPSLPSLPSGPSGSNVTSDTIEAVPKDVKIDIVSDDVKVLDATQVQAQVQQNDNVKDIINLVNTVA